MARRMLNGWAMGGRTASFVLLVLGLLLALGGVASAGDVDDRLGRLTRLESQRVQLEKDRRAADQTYQAKVAEIARLKKAPSSWSRDRKLQKLLAESKDMATALDKKDEGLRALVQQIAAERKAAVAAIDRELAANPPPDDARRARLASQRAQLAGGATTAKKIKVADESIDPLDDPEDLDYKAEALLRSEKQLLEETQRLERRATYYRKQAKLARARTRADEQDVFRDDQPRRSGGSRGGAGGQDAESPMENEDGFGGAAPPPADGAAEPDADPGATGGGGTGTVTGVGGDVRVDPPSPDVTIDPSVVLADVVEPGTLEELRKAERSGDPESRAKAAERARKEVQARAERLRQRRLEMERRAKQLREE